VNLAACSLVTLKSPEKPLSTRDLNARILTREYSAHFVATVGQAADAIAAGSADPAVRLDALRWKIAAAAKSERAASQMAPLMGLLDTWAFSAQMSEFFSAGAGHSLFGDEQPRAVTVSADLQREAEAMAKRLTQAEEFQQDHEFIDAYVRENPLENLHFVRASIVEPWTRRMGTEVKLVDSLGTVPEALADAGDRLRMIGDTGPQQILWEAELAAQQSGVKGEDLQAALRRMDQRMADVTAMITDTPKLIDRIARDAGTRFDASWADIMRDLRAQETELSATVSTERQAAVDALDKQRSAVTADAARIADQVVREAGDEVRRLVREALLLVIVLAIVVLGVPFGAGYFVGRAHRRV
jgi:hypothetical protein